MSKLQLLKKVSLLTSSKVESMIKTSFIDDVQPYCTQTGCVCPHGYQMIETAYNAICRIEESTDEREQQTGERMQCQLNVELINSLENYSFMRCRQQLSSIC